MEAKHPTDTAARAEPTTHNDGSPEDGSTAAPVDKERTARQKVALLFHLADAGDKRLSGGEANKKIGNGLEKSLGLTRAVAKALRQALVHEGLVEATREGRTTRYGLTEQGRQFLAGQERPTPARGRQQAVDESSIPEELRRYQRGYVLLQVLLAPERTLNQADANRRLTDMVRRRFGLTAALANARRASLAEQGYLKATALERGLNYKLTEDGIEYLVSSEVNYHPDFEIKMTGAQLSELLSAAREPSLRAAAPASVPMSEEHQPPAPAELAAAILAEFEDLRREKHGRSGLVPIHEVRARIRDRFGDAAGRHDVLDERIKELWRQRRLGLVAISNPQSATEQQLNDSVPGKGYETLFYLEAAHEQPIAR